MPRKVKGGPFGFFNIYSVAKYQKSEEGELKKSKSHSATKIERVDPLVPSRFVCYAKKDEQLL